MRLFMFESETTTDLRAFAADSSGSKLPERLGPWHSTGVVRPDRDPPHRLSRAAIEKAIAADGFQLWRMKPPATPEPDTATAAKPASAKPAPAKPAATRTAARPAAARTAATKTAPAKTAPVRKAAAKA